MKKWDYLPKEFKNDLVKEYYDALQHKKISLFIKRLLDIFLSVIGLIVLSPIILILAIAIKVESKGPIFYKQERITKYNRKFKILKFRTMIQNADKIGTLVTVENDKRITRVGNIIRKFRLDEIPQLINVLVGDMSFIGTRPEVKKYVDEYTDEMYATLLMRAGITSLTSILFKDEAKLMSKYINKNNNADEVYIKKILPEKMKYNLKYIKRFNLFYDIKICIETVLVVFGIKKID